MPLYLTRVVVAALCVIAAGLVGLSAAPAGAAQSAMLVIGLIGVMALVTTALALSVGAKLWSMPSRAAAAALAASDAIDLERLDSDKG
jgi:hypothetical protein